MLSVTMMVVDHKQQRLAEFRAGLSLVVAPVQYLVDLPFDVIAKFSHRLQSHYHLSQETLELKQNQLLLNVRLQRLAALEKENERLKSLLESSAVANSERVLVAEILKVDLDPFSHRVTLNKGRMHGVYDGQPVVDSHGIVGQVIHVGVANSVALMITDANHALPVQSNRSGVRAIAMGTGDYNQLTLNHVTTTADIKEGDLLVTSGLGDRFPQGYPVAIVDRIDKVHGETFARINIKPVAALDRTREVLLIWSDPQTDAVFSDIASEVEANIQTDHIRDVDIEEATLIEGI